MIKTSFLIPLITDCIGVLVALYFIFEDYIKQYSNDGTLALVTLGMCAWLGIAYYLYTHSYPKIASIMVWIPAIPLLLYGFILVLMVVTKPDFR